MAPEKIGRYQIKSELGRGGMATVYEINKAPKKPRTPNLRVPKLP